MNVKRVRRVITALSLILCGLSFVASVAAGGQSGEAAMPAATEVKTTILLDPGVVDPTAHWIYELPHNMFEPLVRYDYAKNEVIPAGAVSWSVSADNLVWTFNIRKNWKWSDGNPLTAKDYEYAFQEIVNPETASPTASFLFIVRNGEAVNQGKVPAKDLGVKALDDSTLQITLTEPAAWFLSSLSSIGHAVPKATREKFGKDWTRPENIVVSGPYKVTKWVSDSEVVLEKNPNYYDAANVQIDKVTLYIVASESTAMAMYENGEIDTVNVPPTDLDRVQKDSMLSKEFASWPQQRLTMYRYYTTAPPFDDVNVRRAFAMAVDRSTLVSTITRGNEVPAYTMTPPGSIGYIDPSEGIAIKFNAAGAAKLLANAGYPGGMGFPPIVYGYNASETNARIAQALQKMWKDNLGVEVTLKGHEGGGYGEVVQSGTVNIYRWGWGMDYSDANNVWANLFTSDVAFKGDAVPSELDKLVRDAATNPDVAKRKQLYSQVEKLYVQDTVAAVPLFFQSVNVLAKPHLQRPPQPTTLEFWTWKVSK